MLTILRRLDVGMSSVDHALGNGTRASARCVHARTISPTPSRRIDSTATASPESTRQTAPSARSCPSC